jgi:hypothetical protein
MFWIWVLIIAVISFIWAVISYIREKERKEIDSAREEIAKGRVIYHSSDASSSE